MKMEALRNYVGLFLFVKFQYKFMNYRNKFDNDWKKTGKKL